jgi:hypothetical protein
MITEKYCTHPLNQVEVLHEYGPSRPRVLGWGGMPSMEARDLWDALEWSAMITSRRWWGQVALVETLRDPYHPEVQSIRALFGENFLS